MNQKDFFNRYHYDIDRDYLGGGGFGKVYKAFDDTLDRTVAIKVAEVRREQENVSLLKEVELAESIPKHRNIAHYQSCHRFKGPQGTFDYGVLQYYPEGNLSQLLKKEQLSVQQKEGIARGILEGLKHLHDHRIVHRDLKSSNILMARRPGGEYVPKIADFGLSKQFEEYDRSYFSNSFAGGSLLYVAPEQLTGQKIRKNADLWSLGVVLYELFVGEVPFYPRQSDIGTETGRAEIVRQINEASIPKEIEQVPQAWRKVIESCLVTDAKKRVGTVQEIQELLGEKTEKQEASDETKVEKKTYEETVVEQEQQATSEQTVGTTQGSGRNPYLLLIAIIILATAGYLSKKGLPTQSDEQNIIKNDKISKEELNEKYIRKLYREYKDRFPEQLTEDDVVRDLQVKRRRRLVYNTIQDIYLNYESFEAFNEVLIGNAPPKQIKKVGQSKLPKTPMPYISRERKKWQDARKINTKESYREYLSQYPEGEYISEAKSRIEKINNNSRELKRFYRNGEYGFKDSQGAIVISAKYDYARSFYEGLAVVEIDDEYGYINESGEEVIPRKYDNAWSFSEGRARVKLNGKWGYINKSGEKVIPFKYDEAGFFSEGLAPVKLNGKCGYINKAGEEITPRKYDDAWSFSEGLAPVKLNGKWGYINKSGEEVIPRKYDLARYFSEGRAAVKLNGKYGFINKTGEEVIPIKYDFAYSFDEGRAKVREGSSTYYINRAGRCVKDCPE